MCSLLRNASQLQGSMAWAHVIFSSLTGQDPDQEQSMIAEASPTSCRPRSWRGTNYFFPTRFESSMSMDYCKGDSLTANECLEPNSKRCSGTGCDKSMNIRYVASLLQDVFDRVPVDLAERANRRCGRPTTARTGCSTA
jgi:hypothetical protein